MKAVLVFLVLAPVAAFGQLDSYSVTVGASRNLAQPRDQATLNIALTADYAAGPDDILAALKSTGVTLANLSRISNQPGYLNNKSLPNRPVWLFSFTVPLASIGPTLQNLAALAKSIASANNGWQLSSTVQSLSSSNPPQCSTAQLIADAQTRALAIASASGFGLGGVLAIGDETEWQRLYGSTSSGPGYVIYSGLLSTVSALAEFATTRPACAIVVKFKLGAALY
jgi:uncharacterized protein YggE